MALKKKTKKVFLIAGIIIGLIILLNYFGVLQGNKGLSIVPINNFPIETSSPYTCPLDVAQCRINGGIDCFNSGSPPRVIFRTNSMSSSDYSVIGRWIAFDFGGILKSYVYNGVSEAYAQSCSSTPANILTPHGNKVIEASNNILYVCYSGRRYYYPVSEGADLTNIPIEPYTSNNQEITSGALYLYNCYGTLEIRDNQNNVIYSSPINYNSNIPGSKNNSYPQTIYPGYVAKLTSTTSSNTHLWYGTYEEKEDCTKNVCNIGNTGFYQCKNGIVNRNNLTYCTLYGDGYTCQDGLCTMPFQTKDIEIVDSDGQSKTGFTSTEQIYIDLTLIAKTGTPLANIHDGVVKLYFYKLDSPSQPKTQSEVPIDFTSGVPLRVAIENPGSDGDLGLYYLVVKVFYDTTKPPIEIGNENSNQPTYQISIGSQVSCSIQLQTSITDIMTSKLLTNVPILVKLNTVVAGSGSAVQSKNVKVYMNKGTSQETSVTLGLPLSEGTSGDAYTYVWNYQTDKAGNMYVKADVSASGVPASCVGTGLVEDMKITTRYYNTGGNCLPTGPHTFYFETLDSLNRPADTINTLCVKKPGSATSCEPISSSLIIPVSGGKVGQYQFTYDLIKNVGETAQYSFLLTTHSNDYNRNYVVPDLNIEVKDNCVPSECVTTKDCQVKKGDNYICSGGKCVNSKPPYMTYLIFGIVGIILIVAIYFVIRYVRKPSQNVYTGLEGL